KGPCPPRKPIGAQAAPRDINRSRKRAGTCCRGHLADCLVLDGECRSHLGSAQPEYNTDWANALLGHVKCFLDFCRREGFSTKDEVDVEIFEDLRFFLLPFECDTHLV